MSTLWTRRQALHSAAAAALFTLSGCEWLNSAKEKGTAPKPLGPIPNLTPEELVGYLNQQAGLLRTV
ncbi:MAG: hypothetical protein ACRCZF_05270, partial [Gemmataceae bacterium]